MLSSLTLLTQNNTNNNNNNRSSINVAVNSKARRLQGMITLRRMIVSGKSYEECEQTLGISRRTQYRWLKALFEHDRQSLLKINQDEVVRQANILKARYLSIYETLTDISRDTTIDAESRLNACAALAELSRSIALIYSQAPAFIAAENRKKNPKQQQQEILEQVMAYSNRRQEEEAPYRYAGYQRNVLFENDEGENKEEGSNNNEEEQQEERRDW